MAEGKSKEGKTDLKAEETHAGKPHRGRKRRARRRNRKPVIIACSVIMAVVICAAAGVIIWEVLSRRPVAADTVKEYFALLDKGDYAGMYELL